MVHETKKPSLATKLITFVISLHRSFATHGYHQPCDLLILPYEPIFPFGKTLGSRMFEQNDK